MSAGFHAARILTIHVHVFWNVVLTSQVFGVASALGQTGQLQWVMFIQTVKN